MTTGSDDRTSQEVGQLAGVLHREIRRGYAEELRQQVQALKDEWTSPYARAALDEVLGILRGEGES